MAPETRRFLHDWLEGGGVFKSEWLRKAGSGLNAVGGLYEPRGKKCQCWAACLSREPGLYVLVAQAWVPRWAGLLSGRRLVLSQSPF